MTHTERRNTPPPKLPLRTVALVGRCADHHLPETLLSAEGYDVVLVESTSRAYSRIKRARPDLVILWLSSDAPEACQVLSMLALDADTSHIPVLTCFPPAIDHCSAADDPELGADTSAWFAGPVSLN